MINLPMHDSPTCGNRLDPFISVIMPVRNEEACLGRLLRQLLGQDYNPARFEILVVDGSSIDRTREVVAEIAVSHPQVRLLHNPRIWSSAARNIGVLASQGEYLVIVDGHCELPGKQYFRTLADAFERWGADCLGRPQPLDIDDPSPLQSAIGLARASIIGHHPASYIYSSAERFVPAHSVAVAYRREVFEKVGMFDEQFDACEDVELNHRIDKSGLSCLLVPELAAFYRPRDSVAALYRQLHRYGRGRLRLMRKHPETLSLMSLAPAVGMVGALVGWVCALVWPWWAFGYVTMVIGYAVVVAAAAVLICVRNQCWRWFRLLCVVFVAIHLGVAIGVLSELFSGRRRHTLGTSFKASPVVNCATDSLPREAVRSTP